MESATKTRFFAKVCELTDGDIDKAVHCTFDIGRPLGLLAEQTWDAVDYLLADGLLAPALLSGKHVRLTEKGRGRCDESRRRGVD